ncbi:hypothetical protein KW419_13755 [Vibrio fluvialis]|jgi:hypothetical protein|uniref:Exonuclease V subunit gamma n=2 Tax=Vibrio fluvialis TaxID=676 RepID=A0AAX2LQ33_VIBFL|nr:MULTISPECIES: hypothetical protein [Vibrio]TNF19481.1 MAG: hypothetical protein EP325_03895 [Vibrionaceae bacterium]HDM8035837.1 hypothetical protein [Vibrio fluvialis clinical-1]AMF95200.1 hypothetical protein AL536_17370 [Vibrio fluvialis]AVH31163.1 hypothetical protein AL475_04210 [Vibrio fluvialis]EKO3369285.1 hypothetical protein [Vibrio fluvialis]
MKTVICNSLQSFWDMADNQFLEGLDVHCVFPVSENLRAFILGSKERYRIRSITFTKAFI